MSIRFLFPEFLWLLSVLPIFGLLYLLFERISKRNKSKLADTIMFPVLAPKFSISKKRIQYFGILLSILFIILGFSEPRFAYRIEVPKASEIIMVMDLSTSMEARDLPNSRIMRAKAEALELIKISGYAKIGLIVFAGNSYKLSPLTSDKNQLINLIENLTTNFMPVQGTNLAPALIQAKESFSKTLDGKSVIVFSDAEDHEGGVNEAIQGLVLDSIQLNVIGFGSENGSTIGIGKSAKKDKNGQLILTKPDIVRMKEWATLGKGEFIHIKNDQLESEYKKRLLERILKLTPPKTQLIIRESRFPWMYLISFTIALLVFLLSEQKGRISIFNFPKRLLFFGLFILPSFTTFAQTPEQLLRKGNTAYEEKDYEKAIGFYSKGLAAKPNLETGILNSGLALFQQKKYDLSLEQFQKLAESKNSTIKAKAFYNIGNTYLIQKKYKKSINAYQESLRALDKNKDAKYNLLYAMKKLEESQPPNPPPSAQPPPPQKTKALPTEKLTPQEKVQQLQNKSNELIINKNQQQKGSKTGKLKDW